MAPSIVQVGKALGAEVKGFDLAACDEAGARWIRQAMDEHPVLVFRDQKMDAPAIARFGKLFGPIEPHLIKKYQHPDAPEVSYVTNVEASGKTDEYGATRASGWHFDEPYKPHLPQLAMLYAVEIPKEKGGTWFADMRAAHDALPEDLYRRVKDLKGVYEGNMGLLGTETRREAHHPVIFVHPTSKRRILLLSPLHQRGFAGLPEAEGASLLAELEAHATQDQFTYYHQWRVGDVVMWDEVATMHRNAADYDQRERRIFLRTIVH